MRVIMMGTGPFAVPTFEQLYSAGHDVVALVTRPLRSHRGQQIAPPSRMREIAAAHGTPLLDPENFNTPPPREQLAAFHADLLVVCDYGQILAPDILATARLGGINLHASLLPKYRGAAPINWALYHGETETGVTVIHMTPQLDAGPCIAQATTPIDAEETAVEVETRLAQCGASLVRQTIDNLAAGLAAAIPQEIRLASKAPRLKKTDGAIDWTRPATAIKNQIRALEPWPKTYTYWQRGQGAAVRLILGPVDVMSLPGPQPASGTVVEASGGRLLIAAGQGAIAPRTMQPAGKRALPIDEFLRGYRVQVGDQFGPE